ncbi:MAG: TolC family protein [Gemmataceae bacterium]
MIPLLGLGFTVGCASTQVELPTGYMPPPVSAGRDSQTAVTLETVAEKPSKAAESAIPVPAASNVAKPVQPVKGSPFQLPAQFPGLDKPPVQVPKFSPNTPAAERDKAIRAAYPELPPIQSHLPIDPKAQPYTLADLQQLAMANSPVISQAEAEAEVAYGQVIQAGLPPNPTIGYQGDQWQPGNRPKPLNNNGQQGGFINWMFKTAGKLSLAQQVAGYEYVNALVAVRRAQIDVSTQVRTQYFAAIVAKQGMDINKALATMADEVYRLQLKQLAAGEVAGYEPLQLYAQAVQARNSYIQAEAAYQSAWKQLVAAIGKIDLPQAPIAGRADTPAPDLKLDAISSQMLENHTDLLTARNAIAKAQTNLTLQKRIPIPDLQTNQYHQYDNVAQNYQFGIQLGVSLPLLDRNQGNIRSAYSQIASAEKKLLASTNDLTGRLSEAFIRYEMNRKIAANYRDQVIPKLTQNYGAMIQRYQVEPEKVGFNDIVVAQQNLAQALQAYLAALSAQWQAIIDVANVTQMDDLYVPDVQK